MNKGLLFVISGPSGAGKGTVVEKLVSEYDSIGLSVSATTRNMRPGEIEGVSYHFVSMEEFEKMIADGKMLEYNRYVNGNYYGTPLSEVERVVSEGKDLLLEIDVNGGIQVKEKWPGAVRIMIVPPSFEELEARLKERNTETEETLNLRLERAKEEMQLCGEYDYVVVNETGKVDKCVSDIREIMLKEHEKSLKNI